MVHTLLIAFTYLISTIAFVLALYFWKTNSGSTIRKVMVFFLLFTGLWIGTSAAAAYRSPGQLTDFLVTLVYIFGFFGLTTLLHFQLVYPLPIFRMDTVRNILLHTSLYAPPVLFSVLLLFTKTIVKENIYGTYYDGTSELGPLFIVYNLYLLALFLTSLVVSFRRWYPKTSFHRKNVQLVFWSILIGGLPTIILNLVLPSFYNIYPDPLYGVLTNTVWMGAIIYIITI